MLVRPLCNADFEGVNPRRVEDSSGSLTLWFFCLLPSLVPNFFKGWTLLQITEIITDILMIKALYIKYLKIMGGAAGAAFTATLIYKFYLLSLV